MRSILFVLLLFPTILFGQYNGEFWEVYFGKHPSARAQAMGKAYNSIDGDLGTVFYNPAGLATIRKFEINYNFSFLEHSWEGKIYNFLSTGYNLNQYLSFGLSLNHYTTNQEFFLRDYERLFIGLFSPNTSIYKFTIASQPIKNLLIGLNTNYLIWNTTQDKASSMFFDIGVIKKIPVKHHLNSEHNINFGASVVNLNYSKIEIPRRFEEGKFKSQLPVIAKSGVNYNGYLNKKTFSDSLKMVGFLIQGDYHIVLNSKYFSGYNIGGEISLLELLMIRFGYCNETLKMHEFDPATEMKEITYGVGIQLPLYKLTKIPINVNIDFTRLPQLDNYFFETWSNITSFNLRICWIQNKS